MFDFYIPEKSWGPLDRIHAYQMKLLEESMYIFRPPPGYVYHWPVGYPRPILERVSADH